MPIHALFGGNASIFGSVAPEQRTSSMAPAEAELIYSHKTRCRQTALNASQEGFGRVVIPNYLGSRLFLALPERQFGATVFILGAENGSSRLRPSAMISGLT